MLVIDTSYFSNDLAIAQVEQAAVASSLIVFIDGYEAKLLAELLGYELYKGYKDGIGGGATKWTELRDGKEYTNRSGVLSKWKGLKFTEGTAKKSLIANFVYWNYMQDQSSITSGSGEVAADGASSVRVSNAHKMVRAWNEMVGWNWELVEFLLSNASTYPEFEKHYGRIPPYLLRKTNIMGI